MKQAFALPNTPKCRVIFIRDGVSYAAVITTPKDNTDLQMTMLHTKQVGMSQIQRVEPLVELAPLNRPHPAQHRIAKYATPADY